MSPAPTTAGLAFNVRGFLESLIRNENVVMDGGNGVDVMVDVDSV